MLALELDCIEAEESSSSFQLQREREEAPSEARDLFQLHREETEVEDSNEEIDDDSEDSSSDDRELIEEEEP
jgi:hypothetical protein